MSTQPEVEELAPELETQFSDGPPPPPVTIWGERNLPPVLISDIDLTISFIPTDDEGNPTRRFNDFAKSLDDIPNEKVIGLIRAWYSMTENPSIYFVTNRDVKWRDVTIRWLVRLFSPASYKWTLRMRPSNDLYSSAAAIKEKHLLGEIAKKHSISQVWEDDPECILMYKTHGLLVFDAKETYGGAS